MRAEDIVGWSFFLVLFVGIGLMFYGLRHPVKSRPRALWSGSGVAVMGFAFLGFGVLTMYFIRTSARPVIEGNVWAVSNGSAERHGSVFRVTGDSGEVATIRCVYDGPGLREGDRARVRYIQFNDKLIEFTALSGPYTGWHFGEATGQQAGVMFGLVGLACLVGGVRTLRKAAPETGRSQT